MCSNSIVTSKQTARRCPGADRDTWIERDAMSQEEHRTTQGIKLQPAMRFASDS